jgi:hypothetical protein
MADLHCPEGLETKDLRKDRLNFFINTIEDEFISHIEMPPLSEMKKMKNLEGGDKKSFRALFSNKFYYAYNIHKTLLKIKENSTYPFSETVDLLKFGLNMNELKEHLFDYKEQNKTSGLNTYNIAYAFAVWNKSIVDIAVCASQ